MPATDGHPELGRSEIACERATSLSQALDLRARHPDCTVLAGGTDVMVDLEFGVRRPDFLLDIWSVEELRGVSPRDDWTRIGALTTYTELIGSPRVQEQAPSLVESARTVGALQIQNRGTLGGNLGNAGRPR